MATFLGSVKSGFFQTIVCNTADKLSQDNDSVCDLCKLQTLLTQERRSMQ